jgi:hypothetical protein
MRFDSEARYDAGHRYDELNGPGLASPPFKKEKGKHHDCPLNEGVIVL